jgi:hypothetical protein
MRKSEAKANWDFGMYPLFTQSMKINELVADIRKNYR